ncbi:glycosyltransferase family 2 protein [Streptacidiphilus sp. PAMC 29251]
MTGLTTEHVLPRDGDDDGEEPGLPVRGKASFSGVNSETLVIPVLDIGGELPASAVQLRELLAWRPSIQTMVVPFVIVLCFLLLYDHGPRSWFSWLLTVWWSLPVVGSLIGACGLLATRRHIRSIDNYWGDQAPVVDIDSLIVVVPTIGREDTYPALERSVVSYCRYLPGRFPAMRVDIVTEEGCAATEQIAELARRYSWVRVLEVPKAYRTANGTRFKARANHYANEVRIAEDEARDDVWVLHMDDDTAVGSDTALALARFIVKQRRGDRRNPPKHMGQGILTYPRENAHNKLTWLADSARPAADFAQFSVFTGHGTPLAGVHGELLVMRANIEAEIGWDFGPKAIVEDAQWALIFAKRYPGQAGWFNGRCYGASPATLRDFVKQRDRWAWGLIGLATNKSIPFRERAMIGYSVTAWLLAPLQHIAVILLVGSFTGTMNTSPVTDAVLPLWALNVAYAVWTYWEGLKINCRVSVSTRRTEHEMIAVLLLIPLFSLLESWGAIRGLWRFIKREENKFVVIAKPA